MARNEPHVTQAKKRSSQAQGQGGGRRKTAKPAAQITAPPTDPQGQALHPVGGYPICGAEKKQKGGTYPFCCNKAGWKTEHPGSGRCKNHGGLSTGPTTDEGKEQSAKNSFKHGAYVERFLSEFELDIYDALYESAIEKYDLDTANLMHMATLQRACMSYIKTLRLDQWELEREFIPNEMVNDPEDPKNKDKRRPEEKPAYDLEGREIGTSHGKVRLMQFAKTDFEKHFQQYLKILGVDRASEVKAKESEQQQSKALDMFAWLWGGKSTAPPNGSAAE